MIMAMYHPMAANTVVNGLHATSFRPLIKSSQPTFRSPSIALYANASSFKINNSLGSKGLMDYDEDGGPPRWFSPLQCGRRSTSSPLLLFLPGIDGNGLGLTLHHEKLGQIFDIWCLHVPVADRTPLADLVVLVQNTVRDEQDQSAKRPIYLVGESLGASLALLVAAQNPDIDFVLILANPATNLSKCLVQSVLPLSNMIHNQLNAGFPNWMSSIPETVMWKLKMIQEMHTYLSSHLHDVKAQTMILTSGRDMLPTSITEGERLSSMLPNTQTHSFIGNDDPLFADHKFDLVAAIKCAGCYRRGASADYVADFLPPSPSELESACEPFRWMDVAVDPVMLSTVSGKVVQGLAGIPSEGPVLLVSNHMILGLDLVPILSRFWIKENIKLRTIAHPLFFEKTKDGKIQDHPLFDVVRMTGGVPVSANNLYRLFSLKSHVLLYPGGAREALHRKGEEHKLIWPDEPEFVRMAARFGAKIVPFGSVGEDDVLQLLLDCDDQMKIPPLKALIEELTKETARLRSNAEGEIGKQFLYCPVALPKLPGRFYFLFGEPISTEGRKDVLTNKDKARQVYLEVKRETEKCIEYLKDKREKDPYRNLLVRLAYQSYHGFDSPVPTFEV
ncbi:phytyl ester synthase 2, chloroplastic-like isoform X2 [Salvia hispanica]|uniref:phytyl ester synthase 2, chloroplastic-like isoform X2 n=1 Tax=Salvia hispanica TaxID=49212 RepID=UPI00200918A0|nr:phytyl ester synthase 2, chloroplastic-like isoform X2 [Salvia hispanica]